MNRFLVRIILIWLPIWLFHIPIYVTMTKSNLASYFVKNISILFWLQRPAPQSVRALMWTHWYLIKSVRPCRGLTWTPVTMLEWSNTAASAAQSSATERVQQPSPFHWQLSPLSPHTCIINNNIVRQLNITVPLATKIYVTKAYVLLM